LCYTEIDSEFGKDIAHSKRVSARQEMKRYETGRITGL